MKKIKWLGPERVIPRHGVANTDDEKTLPDSLADNFIAQGLCEEVTKPVKKKEGAK